MIKLRLTTVYFKNFINQDAELMNIHNYVTDILIKQLRVSYESSLKSIR
jgi:hypothetical protein